MDLRTAAITVLAIGAALKFVWWVREVWRRSRRENRK